MSKTVLIIPIIEKIGENKPIEVLNIFVFCDRIDNA